MKQITKIIASIFTSIVLLSSCSDFLNEEPRSTWGIDNFYNTTDEAEIALAGIYSYLASDNVYGQTMSVIMESGTDEGYYNRRYNEGWTVGLYRHTSSDNYVKNLWTSLYQVINLSNLFIEKLNKETIDTEEYDRLIAEARFLRAHAYSLLVKWWEEVPMPLTSTKEQSANSLAPASLEELYNQIISDYTFASQKLLDIDHADYVKGRANKMAAHGLLARVYLKMAGHPLKDNSKYAFAKAHCDTLINSGKFSIGVSQTQIVDNGNGDEIEVISDFYRDHFLSYIQNEYDTNESIFEISFNYLRESGIDAHGRIGGINGLAFGYRRNVDGYPSAYAMENASPLLYDLYVSNDEHIRKEWNVPGMQYTTTGNAVRVNSLAANYCPGKFRRWEPSDFDDLDKTPESGEIEPYTLLEANTTPNLNFTGINFPVLRYADVLLMAAEAENEINGPTAIAIGYLDDVRKRAGLQAIEETSRATVVNTKESFFDELVDERLRELCFEGLRKHDLIRWGLLGTKLAELNANIVGNPNYRANDENHNAFLRAGQFFDASKHLSLPYPLQEVNINDKLNQKDNW
ncbi:MAG: RagB/SusD family nutrient uptake outer membrane protein [Flavicella sp.]